MVLVGQTVAYYQRRSNGLVFRMTSVLSLKRLKPKLRASGVDELLLPTGCVGEE